MHTCLYVLLRPEADIIEGVCLALLPFDEHRAVRPYKTHLPASSVAAMAEHYGIPPTDLTALAERLPGWTGRPGGVDRLGLYALVTDNSDGTWDWYEIGGRWQGYIAGKRTPKALGAPMTLTGNTLLAADLLAAPDFADRLPYAILTPRGEWIERGGFVNTRKGRRFRELPQAAWRRKVRHVLGEFPAYRVVCVDVHS